MIKVRTVSTTSISDCKQLQAMLNEGYVVIRADRAGTGYSIVYILEKK